MKHWFDELKVDDMKSDEFKALYELRANPDAFFYSGTDGEAALRRAAERQGIDVGDTDLVTLVRSRSHG